MSTFKYRIRKITKNSRVLEDVIDLDWLCYDKDSITKKELIVLLDNGCICEVVESSNRKVIGCIVYQILESMITIYTLCVHPEYERNGIGSKLLANVSGKMTRKHSGCYLQVPESVIQNGKFLTRNGFLPEKKSSSVRNGKTYYLFSLTNPFFSEVQLVSKEV